LTHTALIKVAPLVTPDAFHDPASVPAGRTLYQRGGLELMPRAPLVIDHDCGREIGQVRQLAEFRDTDGLWLAAHCTVANPPEWLKVGTRASFSFGLLSDQRVGDWRRVLRALVSEVSVLSPGIEPAEPRAKVMLLERHEPAGGIHVKHGQRIVRHGIGKVLAVR
jgi:hypothetical protein